MLPTGSFDFVQKEHIDSAYFWNFFILAPGLRDETFDMKISQITSQGYNQVIFVSRYTI